MKLRMRDNFFAGIIVILPVVITLWLLITAYGALNDAVFEPLIKFIRPYITNTYLEYGVRTLIFLILISFIYAIGLATRILFIRKLFSMGESLFFKIPMIGKVYVSIKQMSRAFLGDRRGWFKKPVILEYPRIGVYSIGFLTSNTKGEIQMKTGKRLVNIFIPTTPNPTSGLLLLVPEEDVINLEMSVEEAMKLVISGGIVTPTSAVQN